MLDLEKLHIFNQMTIHYTDAVIISNHHFKTLPLIVFLFSPSLPLSLSFSVIYIDIFEMKKE